MIATNGLSEELSKMSLRTHGGKSLYLNISDYSTADLAEELARRKGVSLGALMDAVSKLPEE